MEGDDCMNLLHILYIYCTIGIIYDVGCVIYIVKVFGKDGLKVWFSKPLWWISCASGIITWPFGLVYLVWTKFIHR